jgi:putative ABC transport system permease protein
VISSTAVKAAVPDALPNTVAITVQPGDADAVKASLDDLTAPYSSITVQPGNSIALAVKGIFNALISSVNALLGLAVAIAVFGIVNTLILSVTERTPEIGLLRSVGMTRAQLRSSIRSESIIVAANGTTIGIAFGLFVAWALTQPLFTDGQTFSWPWRELAVIALIGLVIGIVASIIPAWRASRVDILEAIGRE